MAASPICLLQSLSRGQCIFKAGQCHSRVRGSVGTEGQKVMGQAKQAVGFFHIWAWIDQLGPPRITVTFLLLLLFSSVPL